MTLTRDQADVLAEYGWQAADILLDGDEGISCARSSVYGRAGGGWERPVWNWNTTDRGIVAWLTPGPPRDDVVLTWAELRAASKALPGRERNELHRARREARRQRARTLAPYLPGGYAPFVMPPPQWLRDADLARTAALRAALDALLPAEDLALFEVPA